MTTRPHPVAASRAAIVALAMLAPATVPVVVVMALVLALLPRAAHAYDVTLTSRTVGQGYQERRYGITGAPELLTRRRLTQYLGLSIYDIEPEAWHGPSGDRNALSFDLALRFDGDIGTYTLDRPRGPNAIAELEQNQIDLLYAYFAGHDIGGRVDFQLGRQIHFDNLDFYSYDGGTVSVRLARLASVEALAGTEVRGELPLSAPIYELDGTSAGSRDPATRPEQAQALRPMFGVALAGGDPGGAGPFRVRAAYRQVLSATVDPRPGDPQHAINHETLSLTGEARWRDVVFVSAALRRNLLLASWDDRQASLRLRLGARHLVSVEYSYLAPSFDGDSIWNVFSSGAYQDVRAAYDVDVGRGVRAHARGFVRQFLDPPGEPADARALAASAPGGRWAGGATAGVTGRVGAGRWRADGYLEAGYGGPKVGGDATARWAAKPNRLDLEGRFTMYAWRDDGLPLPRSFLMAGLQAGALYQMSRRMRLHFMVEDNSGATYVVQLRGLAILEVDASL